MRSLALALLAAAVLAPAASAHSVLLRTQPADGAVLAAAPDAVRLVFDNGVHPDGGNAVIRNGDGSVLRGAPRVEGGRVLVLPLEPGLPRGDYSVRWRIVSEDGHRESGVLAFAVGAGRGPPVAQLEAGEGSAGASVVAARALFFAGLLLAAGTAAFRLVVGREGPTAAALAAGLVAAAAGAAWLAHGAPASRFALAYTVGAGLAAAGALLVAARQVRAAELAALALVPVPSVAGHALDAGRTRLLEVAADVLHVAAASVWVGGVAALLLTLRRPGYAHRFGRLALLSVVVLAATGLVRALGELSSPGQLTETGYGRALLVKSALLLVALAVALANRSRLAAAGVGGEAVVLAGVVVAVAFLTALPPGKDATPEAASRPSVPPPPPPPGAIVRARQDGRLAVALAARGPELTATVVAPDGGGFDGLDVRFRSDGRTAAATPCGTGCYRARLPHGSTVEVDLPGSAVRFGVPAGAPPAGGLVRRAARAFRDLSSVTFHERLSSGPRYTVRTTFVLAKPDRLTYANDEGSSAVVIGGRRWDRQRGGRWVESAASPLTLPAPAWTGPVRDARLLRRTPTTDVVSFYDAGIRAWFEATLDRRLGVPRTLTMIAGSHFMHHTYGAFDAPVQIRPPR